MIRTLKGSAHSAHVTLIRYLPNNSKKEIFTEGHSYINQSVIKPGPFSLESVIGYFVLA